MAEIIEMTPYDIEQLVLNEGDNVFELVDEIVDMDDAYKDSAPAAWIFKEPNQGTYWRAEGSVHVGHYSNGENEYGANLTRVEQVEKVIVRKFWKAV